MNSTLVRKKITFLSHTPINGVFKVGSHHLSRELARFGYSVAHISTPYSLFHKLFNKGHLLAQASTLGCYKDSVGVTHLTPKTVLPEPFTSKSSTISALFESGHDPSWLTLIDQPLFFKPEIRKHTDLLIYRPTDVYTKGLKNDKGFEIIKYADALVTTSDYIASLLPQKKNQPRLTISNGVEYIHFSKFALNPSSNRNGIIYVGSLDSRFNWEELCDLAISFPTETFTICGPLEKTPHDIPPNVIMLGPVDYELLPFLLSQHKIGILPMRYSQLNQGRSPMKLYEYLSAGLHVVVPKTKTISKVSPEVSAYFYSSRKEMLGMMRNALNENQVNLEGIAKAKKEDWSNKAHQLEDFILSIN